MHSLIILFVTLGGNREVGGDHRRLGIVGNKLLMTNAPFAQFEDTLMRLDLPVELVDKVEACGFQSSSELVSFAADFVDRPEVLSSLLIEDFGFQPLDAHRMRSALLAISKKQHEVEFLEPSGASTDVSSVKSNAGTIPPEDFKSKPIAYKKVIVNEKAKRRRKDNRGGKDYGLPSNYADEYPRLALELDEFFKFLTIPRASAQDAPIRATTADVYLRHAKLFLGWYIKIYAATADNQELSKDLSVFSIIRNKEKRSATVLLDFILWLRATRNISASYEANVLRGLTKLVKYRFEEESEADPAYGEKSFDDIALVREMRKFHRDASRRQAISPRSSNEDKKWLSWNEYLDVIKALKEEVSQLLASNSIVRKVGVNDAKGKQIATAFQRYIILAIFASVPDRQRTVRELEIGRTFLKDDGGQWIIKHGPDDYKTGKTYGDRPPLVLPAELNPTIDEFINHWRPYLCSGKTTDYLFLQPRTGNQLSGNSVYQIVSRACHKYTGKKTNPHLLRDMLVTHVRGSSNASEKELEALALYMGHSISMQRNSYDRRTIKQKVAPAINLLQVVNNDKVVAID